ncbi:MAG: NAAT family transporter [Oligoflexia bacterium]|nr:NAAT family transporter [Oligoflexia bacterium]
MEAWQDTIKFALTLVSILNPLGVIPIFLDLTEDLSQDGLKSVAKSCSLAVATTIIISLAFGQKILNFFGISIPSFTIGGGILIFTMAFHMIQAKQSSLKINKSERDEGLSEIGVVPLAIPLLAGPGAISTSIIYAKEISGIAHWVGAFLTVVILSLILLQVLTYGRTIGNKVGKIGLNIFTRIMGIILLSMSIEMIFNGLREMGVFTKAIS